jgi:outer membrane murein-binding lipoprotein Lpp
MKPIQIISAAIFSVLVIAGCSAPVHVQKDDNVNLSSYKTYSWVDTRYSENDNSKRPPAYADISVRNAANAELQKAGWREVSDNADAYISYDVMVERNTARQSDPVYSQSFTRTYYNPRLRRWSTIYYPSQFLGYNSYDVPIREGTITITITDANTDKVIWQAWTTDELNYSRITSEEIQSSVKNIFSKFDVASR